MDTAAAMTTNSSNSNGSTIPAALRHLLTKGGGGGAKQHALQIDGIVQNLPPNLSKSQQTPSTSAYNTYSGSCGNIPSFGQRTLASNDSPIPAVRTSLDSATTGRGSSGIGGWLSKYSLRSPGGSSNGVNSNRNSVNSMATGNGRHSIDSTLAAMQLTTSTSGGFNRLEPAGSAQIVDVETHEEKPSTSTLRVVNRSRRRLVVVYRTLVTGDNKGSGGQQWLVSRRYAEFNHLYAQLKRKFPRSSSEWSELFPSKRWSVSPPSPQVAVQWADPLNSFILAVMADPVVRQCDEVQRFLTENALAIVPIGGANATTIRSPESFGSIGDDRTFAQRMPIPECWPGAASQQPSYMVATRESLERVSMPALKGPTSSKPVPSFVYPAVTQLITPPTSDHSQFTISESTHGGNISSSKRTNSHETTGSSRKSYMSGQQPASSVPAVDNGSSPVVPPRPTKHQSMGVDYQYGYNGNSKSPFAYVMEQEAEDMHVIRKASDSLLYLSAEKRPNIEPLTMRKKYGLRSNLQYVNTSQQSIVRMMGSAPGTGTRPSMASSNEDGDEEMKTETLTAPTQQQHYVPPPHPRMPTMSKSKTWGIHAQASVAGSALREADEEDEDIEMESSSSPSTHGLAIQQAQLCHQTQQRTSTNVNSLMTTLATTEQRSFRNAPPPPLSVMRQQASERSLSNRYEESEQQQQQSGKEEHQQRMVGLDDFQLLSIIGKGSYGKVMLARYKDTGKVMAIKVIPKAKLRGRPNEIRRVMSERKVLERTVKHPFLVGLQCAFQTQEQLFFCLDYVNGGELFFHLQKERRFGENRARFYAAEITSALEYLHVMGVVYRDLKPENCLLDATGHVKIVDFGLAKEVGPVVWRSEGSALYSVEEGGKTGTFCGTPEYLAPEVLLRQRYGKEVDWYCLGAVIYEMLTGLPPFYDSDNTVMYRRILHEPLRFPTTLPQPMKGNGSYNDTCGSNPGKSIGKLAQDFIIRLLERNPDKRLGHGVFGTENIKRHVFFHGIEWSKIYRQEYAPPFVPKVSSIFDLSNIDPEFRNEPIPESITAEGQVDIIAEAAKAERQAGLAMQAQLMDFPSPISTPTARSLAHFSSSTVSSNNSSFSDQPERQQKSLRNSVISNTSKSGSASGSGHGDAFQGFAFVSPTVDGPTPEEKLK